MEVTRTRVDDLRVRQLKAQQMLRGELARKDLESFVEERLVFTKFETAQNWARKNAIFPFGFGLACCGIEMITVIGSPRNDLARFGAEATRFSPRQADLLILSGRVSIKMAPVVRRLSDQMQPSTPAADQPLVPRAFTSTACSKPPSGDVLDQRCAERPLELSPTRRGLSADFPRGP
jgi:hypothetical protein